MSVGSARKWRAGLYPSQARKRRWWRNRPDPFAAVFESEVAPLLAADEKRVLEARTILGELDRRPSGYRLALAVASARERLQARQMAPKTLRQIIMKVTADLNSLPDVKF